MSDSPSGECIDRAECPECGSSNGVQIFLKDGGYKDLGVKMYEIKQFTKEWKAIKIARNLHHKEFARHA